MFAIVSVMFVSLFLGFAALFEDYFRPITWAKEQEQVFYVPETMVFWTEYEDESFTPEVEDSWETYVPGGAAFYEGANIEFLVEANPEVEFFGYSLEQLEEAFDVLPGQGIWDSYLVGHRVHLLKHAYQYDSMGS